MYRFLALPMLSSRYVPRYNYSIVRAICNQPPNIQPKSESKLDNQSPQSKLEMDNLDIKKVIRQIAKNVLVSTTVISGGGMCCWLSIIASDLHPIAGIVSGLWASSLLILILLH